MTETVLQEADRLVSNDRDNDYGHPLDNFTRIARIWSAILDTEITPEQVGLCMAGVKISRECNQSSRDNRVDGAGYLKTVDMIHDERGRRARAELTVQSQYWGLYDWLECETPIPEG